MRETAPSFLKTAHLIPSTVDTLNHIEWFVEYWIRIEHLIAHWTLIIGLLNILNGLLNNKYALNDESLIEQWMVHWILNQALNID